MKTSILSPSLNKIPQNIRHIHLMGICGTGMASLAGILKQGGGVVTGSDQNIYPPMSILLEDLSIPVQKGYDPKNLDPLPDLVIVGNVITRENKEAVELSRLGIPYLSFPQALRHFAMEGKESIVICGTHGKTTTSTLVSWILETAGLDPGFMIGGLPNDFSVNFKIGKGPYFVIEGDEYDTSFFDKGPKFLHYAPRIVILTSIEFDHADIYRDIEHVIMSFRRLIDMIPANGLLIANGDDPVINEEIKKAKCPVITYGLEGSAHWNAVDINTGDIHTSLGIIRKGERYADLTTPLYGYHNISNLLSAVALSEFLEIDIPDLHRAIKGFGGIKRRQEIKGEKRGILVLDDFAHHPTSVRETINAVKDKYKNRRLIAVFEPRSNSSRRNIFQEKYIPSFARADMAMIPEPTLMEKIPFEQRFSSRKLVEDLKKMGIKALYYPDTDQLIEGIIKHGREGDVILIMSNGAFENIHNRLLERL